MDTATVSRRLPPPPAATRPPPPPAPTARPAPSGRDRRQPEGSTSTSTRSFHRPLLVALLIVTFLLRLWGVKQGLPYSYNVGEATHFVPRAIAVFGQDLDPR